MLGTLQYADFSARTRVRGLENDSLACEGRDSSNRTVRKALVELIDTQAKAGGDLTACLTCIVCPHLALLSNTIHRLVKMPDLASKGCRFCWGSFDIKLFVARTRFKFWCRKG